MRFRRFDARGLPLEAADSLLSPSADGIQVTPAVTSLPGGGFAAVWADNSSAGGDLFDVKLRLFDSTATPMFFTTANLSAFYPQIGPRIEYFRVSDYLIIFWENQSARAGRLVFRRFDPSGRPLDLAELFVPSGGQVFQSQPRAAESPDGDFVIVWTGSEDGVATAIFAMLFNPSAEGISRVIEISSGSCTQNYDPSVAWYGEPDSGRFVVVWERLCPASLFPEVAATTLSPSDPTVVAEPFTVSLADSEAATPVVLSAKLLAVQDAAAAPTLQWITTILWVGTHPAMLPVDGPYDILAQRFTLDASGEFVPFGAPLASITTTNRFEQSSPAGAQSASGRLLITWTDYSRLGSDAYYSSVRGRFLPNGWVTIE